MSRFNFGDNDDLEFDSPQKMYADYKKKTINGILDYQSNLIDSYMKNAYNKKDVAIELPTGGGKTLVGLLIGEYRRRKENQTIVYVCTTTQLVNQVVEQANTEYGINAVALTGPSSQYESVKISAYRTGASIAVTNYSSIFNTNSFFEDCNVLIFDDAHSAENYIANNWTLTIDRENNNALFYELTENLKPVVDSSTYRRLAEEVRPGVDEGWCDLVPMSRQFEVIDSLYTTIDQRVIDTTLKYSWSNIKDNLENCNIYLSKSKIVIRPYIPPTIKSPVFSKANHRIYMSATLGKSGELERTLGVSKISKVQFNNSDSLSIGRRFFVFPNAKFEENENFEIYKKIKRLTPRGIFLVESNTDVENVVSEINKLDEGTTIYKKDSIADSIDTFKNDNNAVVVLANRYDGINMKDDVCRFLILKDLPSATHLQEKFFISKLSTAALYNERIKTRITQAVGRCTRSTVDYAVIMVIGRELENALITRDKLAMFSPELRAEINVGFNASASAENIDDFVDIVNLGFTRDGAWDEIENQIIKERNKNNDAPEENIVVNNQLVDAAKLEVEFHNAFWMKDYDTSISKAIEIIDILKAPSLGGYRQYWNYMIGSVYYLYSNQYNKPALIEKANEYFEQAATFSNTITWFRNLKGSSEVSNVENNYVSEFSDILDNIESSMGLLSPNKVQGHITREYATILELLKKDSTDIEAGIQRLGEFLGYKSYNSKEPGAPDPYWIFNGVCIVTEVKIYENEEKKIPKKHVTESMGHISWIKERLHEEDYSAELINVFVSNSFKIENSAIPHARDIYYINRDDLIKFADKSMKVILNIKRDYISNGQLLWRIESEELMKRERVTPLDFINLIKTNKLQNLSS